MTRKKNNRSEASSWHILITGLSGRLGSSLGQKLIYDRNVEVLAGIDIIQPSWDLKSTHFLMMDVRNPIITKLLDGYDIDTVIHTALPTYPSRNINRMEDIFVNGTLNVLESSKKTGVKNVILISNTFAYGALKDNDLPLTEDSPLRAGKNFPYAYLTAKADELVRNFAISNPDMNITVLRPCTVLGPGIDNVFTRRLFSPGPVQVMGADPEMQFLHVNDFVTACITAMKKSSPGIYNIAGDGVLKLSEVHEMAGVKAVPLPGFLLYSGILLSRAVRFPRAEYPAGLLPYLKNSFVASNEKARNELGAVFTHTSRDAVVQAITERGVYG